MKKASALLLVPILLIAMLLASCGDYRKETIGLSMAGTGNWPRQLYEEVKIACMQYPGVRLISTNAYESQDLQKRQMDSLIDAHVDAIILAPHDYDGYEHVLQRAKDAGIPVILVDRKVKSDDYTAYIGHDDESIGYMMGKYIALQRKGKPTNIVEISGLPRTSPAMDRAKGFRKAIAQYPNLHIVGTAAQSWQPDSVRAQAIQFLATHPNLHIDCVYGHNDDNAMIMRDVISQTGRYPNVKYYGIDGLPRKDGGLAMVQQGKLEATIISPTRGYLVVEKVMQILDGKPYKRITKLSTSIVDRSNIDVVGTQTILMEEEMKMLSKQNNLIMRFYDKYKSIHVYMVLNAVILLLVIFSFFIIRRMKTLNRELKAKELTVRLNHILQEAVMKGEISMPEGMLFNDAETHIMTKLFEAIARHIDDPRLNAEMIANDLGVTTQQVNEAIMKLTGKPVDEIIAFSRKYAKKKNIKFYFK